MKKKVKTIDNSANTTITEIHEANANKKLPHDGRADFPIVLKFPIIYAIIGSLIFVPGLISISEGGTDIPQNPESSEALAPPPPLSLRVDQARKHPSYQVFEFNLTLPSITVIDAATLEAGGKVKINLGRSEQLSTQAKETLAELFQVPVAVVDKFWKSIFNNTTQGAEQVANAFRTTLLDYKYLYQKWNQFRPSKEKESIKANAFLALQAGDTDKAWEMYLDLRRPTPPSSVAVIDFSTK